MDWFDEGDFDLLHEWKLMARPFGKPGFYAAGIGYRDKEHATIKQDPAYSDTKTTDNDWAFYANFNQSFTPWDKALGRRTIFDRPGTAGGQRQYIGSGIAGADFVLSPIVLLGI